MTSTSHKILFFGNERLVSGLVRTEAPILRGLLKRGYDIKAVVSHHSDTRSRKPRPLEVAEAAAEHDIPVFLPDKPMEIYETLAEFQADAAVLVAYGKIIPQKLIDLFPLGIINVHPSLLPKYRGPTPIESPILNGDSESGVSIMQLSSEMDAGPVYAQVRVAIEPSDTKFTLYGKLERTASDLLFGSLPAILDGSLQPTPQNDAEATYCQLLSKADGLLDPKELTAKEAERHVRAYLGFPKSKLVVSGHPIIITKAHVIDQPKTPLDIKFRDGAFLAVDELIAPSGKAMSGEAFLRGYAAGGN